MHIVDFIGYLLSQILDLRKTSMKFLEEVRVTKVVSKLERKGDDVNRLNHECQMSDIP